MIKAVSTSSTAGCLDTKALFYLSTYLSPLSDKSVILLCFFKVEYSQRQIKDLLSMINAGNLPNKNRPYESANRGLHRSISAYGIVGEFNC